MLLLVDHSLSVPSNEIFNAPPGCPPATGAAAVFFSLTGYFFAKVAKSPPRGGVFAGASVCPPATALAPGYASASPCPDAEVASLLLRMKKLSFELHSLSLSSNGYKASGTNI